MSDFEKKDGAYIIIEFTEELTEGTDRQEDAFTVIGEEYLGIPDGPIIEREYFIDDTSIALPFTVEDELDSDEDWDAGTHDDTEARSGRLELAEAVEE